jgi:hypothetical protein
MLPNTKNNSDQVKRMLYSKVKKDHSTENEEATGKKLQELKEIFAHHSKQSTPRTISNLTQESGDDKKYIYPFILNVDDDDIDVDVGADDKNSQKKPSINANANACAVCIYRVFGDDNKKCKPFLQFKLQKRAHEKVLSFPMAVRSESDSDSDDKRVAADRAVKKWFPEAYANNNNAIHFRCTRTDPVTGEMYAVYEETSDAKTAEIRTDSSRPDAANREWWWVCVHEIMNRNKIASIDIHSTVTHMFEHVPSIMFLYDSSTGNIMETPHILYSGITEGSSVEDMVLLGPRKLTDNTFLKDDHSITDPNERRMYGSQYYLYEYDDVFRSACYTMSETASNRKYVKRSESPYLFRYAVFLGNTSTVIFDTDNSTTNPSIHSIREYYNTSWCSKGYDSVQNGEYEVSNTHNKRSNDLCLSAVFCVCDIERIIPLSHYQIDPKTVPVKYTHREPVGNYEIL